MLWGRKDQEDRAAPPSGTKPPRSGGVPGPAGGGAPLPARPMRPSLPLSEGGREGAETAESLPQALLAQGKVNCEDMQRAVRRAAETGLFIGDILVEEGVLDEEALLTFLTKYCKIPHLSLLDYLIDESLFSLIPQEMCLEYHVLPIDRMGRNLTVAMVNPLDAAALDAIRARCPGLRVKPILCASRHFETVIRRFAGGPAAAGAGLPRRADPSGVSRSPSVSAPRVYTGPLPPVPAPSPPREKTRQMLSEADDALLQSVFEMTPVESDEEPGMEDLLAAPDAGRTSDDGRQVRTMPEDVAVTMTNVMMDSMRNTYGILARRMDLFRGLSPENVARVFARGSTEEFEEGQTIFEKGSRGETMYVILSGGVAIVDGDRILATMEQGEMFGEMALVTQSPRTADARALSDVAVLSLTMDDIMNTLGGEVSCQILVNIIIALSHRLRRANVQ